MTSEISGSAAAERQWRGAESNGVMAAIKIINRWPASKKWQ
jgi:hypothetical protein